MTVAVIGNGFIGKHIQKVLSDLNILFEVYTGSGRDDTMRIDCFPAQSYDYVFIAVPIGKHKNVLELCTRLDVPIYIEKPGLLIDDSIEYKSNIYVGYNRRFYKPVQTLKEKVQNENINIFHFDFSELVGRTDFSIYDDRVVHQWFLANSIHVLDTVEFIFGTLGEIHIQEIPSTKYRQLIGSGKTLHNNYFTFRSVSENYSRWAISATSSEKQYNLCPMESLVEKNIFSGESNILAVETGEPFKEGYYEMIKAFCNSNFENFSTLEEAHEKNKRLFSLFGDFMS